MLSPTLELDAKISSDLLLRSSTSGSFLSISGMRGEGAASDIDSNFLGDLLQAVSIYMPLAPDISDTCLELPQPPQPPQEDCIPVIFTISPSTLDGILLSVKLWVARLAS